MVSRFMWKLQYMYVLYFAIAETEPFDWLVFFKRETWLDLRKVWACLYGGTQQPSINGKSFSVNIFFLKPVWYFILYLQRKRVL